MKKDALAKSRLAAAVAQLPGLKLTNEQLAVINHAPGTHLNVISVPGAGKTTTVAHLIAARILAGGQAPKSFVILVFNRRAAAELKTKLATLLPKGKRPAVNTFHSWAGTVISAAEKKGHIARQQRWTSNEERPRSLVRQVIWDMEKNGDLVPNDVSPDDAWSEIATFKNALIAPADAGHAHKPDLAKVYRRFEGERAKAGAITFDDYVPMAVDLLGRHADLRDRFVKGINTVVVDEAQDLNEARTEAVALLASGGADVVAVGDDDQEIYAWNGASSTYFTNGLPARLVDKPTVTLPLTTTFRFGPGIAVPAQALIGGNSARAPKILRPNTNARDQGRIEVVDGVDAVHVNRTLVDEILTQVNAGTPIPEIRVLARSYSQMAGIALELLFRAVPHEIVGDRKLVDHPVVRGLLAYVLSSAALDDPMSKDSASEFLRVVNFPNRKINKRVASEVFSAAVTGGRTMRQALEDLARHPKMFGRVRARVWDLLEAIDVVATGLADGAGPVLKWLADTIELDAYLDRYLARDQASVDRKQVLVAFLAFAEASGESTVDLALRLVSEDPTRGAPRDEVLQLSTVHRVKGLEWDVVVIPDCVEGQFPVVIDQGRGAYDRRSGRRLPPVDALEAERRLFYVALTRARSLVLVGAPDDGDRLRRSRFVDEAGLMVAADVATALNTPTAFVEQIRGWSVHFELVEVAVEAYAADHSAWSVEIVEEARAELGAAKTRELEARERRAELATAVAGPERQLPPASWAELD